MRIDFNGFVSRHRFAYLATGCLFAIAALAWPDSQSEVVTVETMVRFAVAFVGLYAIFTPAIYKSGNATVDRLNRIIWPYRVVLLIVNLSLAVIVAVVYVSVGGLEPSPSWTWFHLLFSAFYVIEVVVFMFLKVNWKKRTSEA